MTQSRKPFRYKHLSDEIEKKIKSGIYRPGEKLPSIRRLHKQFNLSISTVYKSFLELEALGLIEARPKSGYYVSPLSLQGIKAPRYKSVSYPPTRIHMSSMINSVLTTLNNNQLLPLGMTVTDAELLPYKQFSRILKSLSHQEIKSVLSYSLSEGLPELRRQLSKRTMGILEGITPADIIITNGCMEAIALALLSLTSPGDTVAIEAPTNFNFLQLLKELKLMVVEVPTSPRFGVDIHQFKKVIMGNSIKACLFMPNFHNPIGSVMPDDSKAELVRLAGFHGIPVIEDDISSELFFGHQRPMPLKAFDNENRIITCSSFSKTLAPGFRIGWIIPGERYKERIQNLKGGMTISTSTLDQYLIAQYLRGGAYDRHLRYLRNALKKQMVQTVLSIQKYFPQPVRLTVPEGGSLLWVELPPHVDAMSIHQSALNRHIAVIPGSVCSNSGQFRNYIQISCGSPFTAEIEKGISELGELVNSFSTS